MQTLTYCDAKSHEHAHSSWSVKGQFKGAMERYVRGFDLAWELTPRCHDTPQTVSTRGAIEP